MNLNLSVWSGRLCFLLICSWSLSANATHRDYPTLDDDLSQLLVDGMNGLMNDFSPDNPDYPTFTDEHYRARFLEMSGAIQYRLTTDIKNHIIHRTQRYRSATERTLGLSEMYFPVFEEYLAAKDMPYHLKYLPIVESNLNPVARSRAAAVGLWQFIPGTAKLYGLKVTSHLDERSDTHKASNAATTMLSNLYKRYGDWALALSAYNCGPGRVDRYVKGNNKTYWQIRSSLPRETQMYVPYFMAVAYCYEFYHLHELNIKHQPQDLVLTDSIHLEPGYKTLDQLSKRYGISRDTLKRLNPSYIRNYVPSSGQHYLILPARIVAKERNCEASYRRIMEMRSENPIKCIRRINNERELAHFMKAHRFSRHDLLFWNGLPSNYIAKPGDMIAIRKYTTPKDVWAKQMAPPTIESINIASLEVVGLDDQQKKALTAPVYVNIETKKLSQKNIQTALAPANKTANINKNNPYQLSNRATAMAAQPARKTNVLTTVTENRDRGRRLRPSAVEPAAIKSTPVEAPTAAASKAAEEAAKKQAKVIAQAKAMREMQRLSAELSAGEEKVFEQQNKTQTETDLEAASKALQVQTQGLEEAEKQAITQAAVSKTEAEAARKAAELKQAEEAEAARKAAELKQAEEAEAARKAAELKQAEEAEAARKAAELKQAEEAEAARKAAELKQAEEAEAARKAAELKQAEEAEAARKAAELKQAEEAEAARKAAELKQAEEAEAARKAAELKAAAEAKAIHQAAELKAQKEAEAAAARQAAERKAQQEAEAKAAQRAAELQAQQEAEAKAEATRRAQEDAVAKAKREQETLSTTYEYYIVKDKDTPWTIARQYRAEGVTAHDIMNLNNITAETILHEGMRLKVRVR